MQKIFLKNLRGILKEKNIKQDALAIKIRRGQSFVSKLVRLEQGCRLTDASRIADALEVSIERLIGKAAPAPPPRDIRVVWDPARLPLKEPLSRLEGNFLPIPIYGVNVVGGSPELISQEQIEDVALIHRAALQRKTTRGLVCTSVKGDSMFPILRDGAIVCIDTMARPERGKVPKGSIWAIRKDGGVVVKHLLLAESAIVLISANPTYPPESISSPEAVVGRVIWVWQGL